MTDKVQKIRNEVEKLKSNLMYGACSSQVAMETRCKEEAYNEVLSIMDSMQEEPKECMYSTANFTNADRLTLCKDCEELCKYNQKTAAESLGISQEVYDEIVDKCLYGSEVELVDDGDLPKEEPVSEDLEAAIDNYLATYFGGEKEKQEWPFLKKMAIHFAAWQKQQMIKKAFSVEIGKQRPDYKCVLNGNFFKYDTGEKVKVIIIKEE